MDGEDMHVHDEKEEDHAVHLASLQSLFGVADGWHIVCSLACSRPAGPATSSARLHAYEERMLERGMLANSTRRPLAH